jgi:hypothetical protein
MAVAIKHFWAATLSLRLAFPTTATTAVMMMVAMRMAISFSVHVDVSSSFTGKERPGCLII